MRAHPINDVDVTNPAMQDVYKLPPATVDQYGEHAAAKRRRRQASISEIVVIEGVVPT